MNDLYFSINTVLPLFMIIGAGYLLALTKVFKEDFIASANKACFNVFLPVLVFYNIYRCDFKASFNPKLILFTVGAIVVIFLAAFFAVPKIVKRGDRKSVVILSMYLGNYLLMGVPMSERMYGAEGAALASFMAAFVVPCYNLLATFALSAYSGGERQKLPAVIKKVFLNPLIIGSIAGIFFALFKIKLPAIIESPVASIAAVGTPLALMVLGAEFKMSAIRKNSAALTVISLIKLVIIPAVVLTVAALLGFSGPPFAVIISAICTPIAVTIYVFAVNEKADSELAGQLVVVTALLSMFTMFGIIYVSKILGLL